MAFVAGGEFRDRGGGVLRAGEGFDWVGGGRVEVADGAVVAFGGGGFDFVAEAEVEGELAGDFVVVVDVEAVDGVLFGIRGVDAHVTGGNTEEEGGEFATDLLGGGCIEGAAGEGGVEGEIGRRAVRVTVTVFAEVTPVEAEADVVFVFVPGEGGVEVVDQRGSGAVAGFPVGHGGPRGDVEAGEGGGGFFDGVDEAGGEAETGEIEALGDAFFGELLLGEAVADVQENGGVDDVDVVEGTAAVDTI